MSKKPIPTSYVMRYMGSKLNLVDFIVPVLSTLLPNGAKFLDLMAGTHAIGYAMKPNHPIVANDIQEYSRIIGISRIANNTFSPSIEDIENDILNNLKPSKDYNLFQTHYVDTYFSLEQCKEIDNIRAAISEVKDPLKSAVYLTALIYAMGYSQSSPGHFAQYMPYDHPRLHTLRKLSVLDAFRKKLLENHLVFSKYENQVVAVDYRELFSNKKYSELIEDTRLVYVDPPYSEAQYSRFYHLLETAVKYDYPELNHKGLYRNDRFQSNFCYKSKAPEEFEYIAEKTSSIGANIAISYSDRGLVSMDQLHEIVAGHFSNVQIYKQKYNHSMQGRGRVTDLHEILITGTS